MIIVRIYQALDTLVVESSASVQSDDYGLLPRRTGVFLGREYLTTGHDADPMQLGEVFFQVLERAQQSVKEDFGGWRALL